MNGSAELPRALHRRLPASLRWFGVLIAVAAATGTLLYCYEQTLAAIRVPLVWVHGVSGDLAAVTLIAYLARHLPRTWPVNRPFSRWSGIGSVIAWTLAVATGMFGQFVVLRGAPLWWWIHAGSSLVAILLTAGHATSGYRAHRDGSRENT